MIIKLEGEIDLDKTPNEIKIKSMQDPWADLGCWLEATGFMAYQSMKYREWSEEKILDYCRQYIEKCLKDYKIKKCA